MAVPVLQSTPLTANYREIIGTSEWQSEQAQNKGPEQLVSEQRAKHVELEDHLELPALTTSARKLRMINKWHDLDV